MDDHGEVVDGPRWDFSIRFRKVSTRYARRVWEAYEGDIERAMADDDATVAARVVAWERVNGLVPRDWVAIGRAERADDEDGIEGRPLDDDGLILLAESGIALDPDPDPEGEAL